MPELNSHNILLFAKCGVTVLILLVAVAKFAPIAAAAVRLAGAR